MGPVPQMKDLLKLKDKDDNSLLHNAMLSKSAVISPNTQIMYRRI